MKSFVLASLLALASLSPAGATLLSTLLLPGGSLSNGSITIDDFAFTRTCGGTGVCAPADASGIDVTLVGNQIHFIGGFSALNGGGGFASADFLIAYDLVSVPSIDRVGLLFNGAVVGDQSFAQVVETIITPIAHVAGQGSVNAPTGPLVTIINLDDAYHAMRITKDIFLLGSDTEGLGVSSISFIDQAYATPGQVTPFCVVGVDCEVTPEPSTYATLGIGLISFYFARRRSHGKS